MIKMFFKIQKAVIFHFFMRPVMNTGMSVRQSEHIWSEIVRYAVWHFLMSTDFLLRHAHLL